jgi:hypothetical protein
MLRILFAATGFLPICIGFFALSLPGAFEGSFILDPAVAALVGADVPVAKEGFPGQADFVLAVQIDTHLERAL